MLGRAALAAVLAACPGPHPVTPRIAAISDCGPAVQAEQPPGWTVVSCYDANADTITIDPRTPSRLVCPTLAHELVHRQRFLAGDPLWRHHGPIFQRLLRLIQAAR